MSRSPTPSSRTFLKAADRCFRDHNAWINKAIPEAGGGEYADYDEPHLKYASRLIMESESGPSEKPYEALWGIRGETAGWLCLLIAAELSDKEKRRGK